MKIDRRKLLKRIGFAAGAFVGASGLAIWRLIDVSPSIEGSSSVTVKRLAIDPNGAEFIYKNGYIVAADR